MEIPLSVSKPGFSAATKTNLRRTEDEMPDRLDHISKKACNYVVPNIAREQFTHDERENEKQKQYRYS
jgi:hypothetical protein